MKRIQSVDHVINPLIDICGEELEGGEGRTDAVRRPDLVGTIYITFHLTFHSRIHPSTSLVGSI